MKKFIYLFISIFLLSASLATVSQPVHGQQIDLVKLKKEEEERRKKLKESDHKEVVITNETLKKYGTKKKTDEKNQSTALSSGDSQDTQESKENKSKMPDPQTTREYWQNLKNTLETRLKELKVQVEKDQLEFNRLFTQHLIMDIPLEKQRLKKEMDDMGKQLEMNKKRLESAQKDYDMLPEKARKAGVPPGWIR